MRLETSVPGVRKIPIPTPFAVGDVNLYVLQDGDGVTLVDTGPLTKQAEAALEAGLKESGLAVEDVGQIVLTHYHVDHTGLLAKLVRRSGAKVYAHPLTGDLISQDPAFLERRVAFFRELYRGMGLTEVQGEIGLRQLASFDRFLEPARVDEALADGQALPGHEDWRVVYTPGHAQDHLSLYRQRDGVMLLGDHLIAHVSSNAFIETPAKEGQPRPRTLVLYREALRKVQGLDWQIGFAGHGTEITDGRELIEKRLRDQEKRAAAVVEQVKLGRETGIDICLALFPRHLNQLPLIVSETLGHLDRLEADGVLVREEGDGGVWRYRVA